MVTGQARNGEEERGRRAVASYLGRNFSSRLRFFFFFSSRRRHTRFDCDWSSDVCSSDLRANHGSSFLTPDQLTFPPLGHLRVEHHVLSQKPKAGILVQTDRPLVVAERLDRKSVV